MNKIFNNRPVECLFYKGPLHNQRRVVDGRLLTSGVVSYKSPGRSYKYSYNQNDIITTDVVIYRPRMFRNIDGILYPATHPSGAVYLIYDGE